MPESKFVDQYFQMFEPYFEIDQEVYGSHFSGKRLRIDAVMKPKNPDLWKRKDVAFGIEIKDIDTFDLSYDTKNLTKWLAQCVDYSNTKWDKYGYIYIFTFPGLTDLIASSQRKEIGFLRNFMGQLGVGEIRKSSPSRFALILHGQHRMWSSWKGVEEGKNWGLERKFGSR